MRGDLRRLPHLAMLLCAGVGSVSAEETATSLPQRRPGLWRIATISPQTGLQRNDVCITESDGLLGEAGAGCAPPAVRRAGDQIIVTLDCGRGAAQDVVSLLFTGDFRSWYHAQSHVTSKAGRFGVTIDATYLGERCDDAPR